MAAPQAHTTPTPAAAARPTIPEAHKPLSHEEGSDTCTTQSSEVIGTKQDACNWSLGQLGASDLPLLSSGSLETVPHNLEHPHHFDNQTFDQHHELHAPSRSTFAEAKISQGDQPHCVEMPAQSQDDAQATAETLPQEGDGSTASFPFLDPSSPQPGPTERPIGPDDVICTESQPVHLAIGCQDPDEDVGFLFERKRPPPSEEEDASRKKQKLGTCPVVIQKVSIPGACGTDEFKWSRRDSCWKATKPTAPGGEITKGRDKLAQEVKRGRVEVRPNGWDLPILLKCTEESGYFEGDDHLEERKLRMRLNRMKRMIPSGRSGKCTYHIEDIP
jgi:hypothetical protein